MSGDQALVYSEQLIESPIYEGLDLIVFDIADDTLAFNLGRPIRNADELAEVLKG